MVTRKKTTGFVLRDEETVELTEVVDTLEPQVEPVFVELPVEEVKPIFAELPAEEVEPVIIRKVEPLAPVLAPKPKVVKPVATEPRHPRNVPRFTEVAK
jgi:hypothetical protein